MRHLLRKLALRLRAGLRSRYSGPTAARHRRILVEPLEDRSLLAQLVNVGTATDVAFNLPASANVVFLEDDGTAGNGISQIRSSNGTFDTTTFANPTGSLTINRGNAADAITINALADFTAGLTIGLAGSEFSSVTFAGAITLAANKGLVAKATGTISLPNSTSDLAVSGNGTITLTAARNISLASGSSITSVDGATTLSANQQAARTSGAFIGIDVNAANIRATGTGTVTVEGRAGDSEGGLQYGVRVASGGKISGGTGGLLTVQGTGGATTGIVNHGVWVFGEGSAITSSGGNVQVMGQGGGTGPSSNNIGVFVYPAGQISAGGNGTVTVQGTGGAGSGVFNHGVEVYSDSAITSNGGNVQVTGQGGGTDSSGSNVGVLVYSTSQISAGGNGTVTVQGTGGAGSDGGNYGIQVYSDSAITSSGGNVQVTGQGGGTGSSSNNAGVFAFSGSQIIAGGNGTVTVQGTGGSTLGNTNYGVLVSASGSAITSNGGNVQVTGQGGGVGASANNIGVFVHSAAQITAGGSGTVAVQGSGGASSGSGNNGIRVFNTSSSVTSNGGDVQVTGIAGSGTSSTAILVGGTISTASAGGALILVGNSMSFESSSIVSASATSSVTVRTLNAGVGINLGLATDPSGGPLGLSDAELDMITGGSIIVGDPAAGDITISADLTQPGKNLKLTTATGVSGSGAIINGTATLTTLTFDQAGDSTYGGIIGGAAAGTANDKNLSFTKTGVGTLTLTAANNFTGTTLVGAGGLFVNGSLAGNVSVSSGATLGGTGTAGKSGTVITVNSGGHLAPGAGGPGILRSSVTNLASGASFDALINGTALGGQYSQLVASNGTSINGATLKLTLGFTPAVGSAFTIMKNSNATGTFAGLPEGKVFTTSTGPFSATFQITYRGFNGDDVILTAIDPVNPVLQFPKSGGDWLVKRSGENVVVSLEGTPIFSPPFASLSSLTISALYSDHTVTLDLSEGDVIPEGGLVFKHTGINAPRGHLVILGGDQGDVNYSYSNANDGSIVMSNYGKVTYTDLEFLQNSGTADNVTYNLPAGPNAITLGDDGDAPGNGLSHLYATTIVSTYLANPTGSLTLNRGNAADTVSVSDLPDFNAALSIGSSGAPFATTTFLGAVALDAGKQLSASAQSISVLGAIATSGGGINLDAANGITIRAGLNTHGGHLTLNADTDGDGAGTIDTRFDFFRQAKLDSPTGANFGQFGAAVATSSDGNTVIVGAPGEDANGTVQGGTATVFVRNGDSWIVQQQLTNNGGTNGDNFGISVALSADGNTALVGAFNEDIGSKSQQGTATVFVRSGGIWTAQQKLTMSGGGTRYRFGFRLALSSDGNTAVFGVPNPGVGPGTVVVFTRTGSVWTERQQLTGTDVVGGDNFGISVAVSSDGSTILAGAYLDDVGANVNQGSAYVFVRSGNVWTQQQQITTGAAGDYFGWSVALSSDGNTALIGAEEGDGDRGYVSVFERNAGVWTQQQKLTAGSRAPGDRFSEAVTLSSNGNTAVVTAVKGAATVFTRSSGVWALQSQIPSPGLWGALSGDGEVLVVGNSDEHVGNAIQNNQIGRAYVLTHSRSRAGDGFISASAADMQLSGPMIAGGTVSLTSSQVGRPIELGGSTVGALGLTDAELDLIAVGTLQIGDTTGGAINIRADITRPSKTDIVISSGDSVNFSSGLIDTAGGDLWIATASNASVLVGKPGTDARLGASGTLHFASGGSLSIAINGLAVDAEYDQLNLTGQVDLTGTSLRLSGDYDAAIGERFVIINNDGTDAVIGTFEGLSEGAVVENPVSGQSYQITYHGGDGNDVVLTVLDQNPILQGTSGDDDLRLKRNGSDLQLELNGAVVWSEPFDALKSLTIDGLEGKDTLTVDLTTGDAIPADLTFHGGDPTSSTGDKLVITGGDQGTVTYDYSSSSAHDGSIGMSNYGTVNYAGVESIVNSGTATAVIFNLPAGPNVVTLGDDGVVGNSLSRLSGAAFDRTDFANPSGSLTINRGNAADAITVSALPNFTAGLTIGTEAAPLRTIGFSGAITLAANKSLIAFATEAINSGADITTSGTGAISLTTTRNISLSGGALTTVDGNLTLSANQQEVSTDADFAGVTVKNAIVQVTGRGNLTVLGRGGGHSAMGNHGIELSSGAIIRSTLGEEGAGTVTLVGVSTGIGNSTMGVHIIDNRTLITSAFGNISISGKGTDYRFSPHWGMQVGGTITSTGPASITLNGTGGSGSFDNVGIIVTGNISSSAGGIILTGQGGLNPASTQNDGIRILGTVESTGTAKISINGTGGSGNLYDSGVVITGTVSSIAGEIDIKGTGGAGSFSSGVKLDGAEAKVASIDGNISITGWGGTETAGGNAPAVFLNGQVLATGRGTISIDGTSLDSSDVGIGIYNVSNISSNSGLVLITGRVLGGGYGIQVYGTIDTSQGSADIELVADAMIVGGGLVNAGNRTVILRPETDGRPIDVGGPKVADSLSLSDAELDWISAADIRVGSIASGPVTITSNITRAEATAIQITSGSSIGFTTGSIDTAGGDLTLTPGSASSVRFAKTGNDVSAGESGTLSFATASQLAIAIHGPTADSGYEQLNVAGKVDLTGLSLLLSGSYSPVIGDEFVIVNNDGDDDVIGKFAGLPNGKHFQIASGELAGNYRISYFGGDGNDVVIKAVKAPPRFDHLPGDYSTPDENPVTHGPAGELVVEGWATNIVLGPENEAAQGWEFETNNDWPALFAVGGQPRVDGAGTLRFTPNPNARGIANVTVVLQADGGGTNSSDVVTFQIEITKPRQLHNSAEAGERNGLDVTGSTSLQPDGSIVAGDALAVINYINAKGSGPIKEEDAHGPPYYDVTGDNQIAGDDVLKVINYINSAKSQEGEAQTAFLAIESQNVAMQDVLMLDEAEPTDLGGQSNADLLTFLAADLAAEQLKRRRAG